MYVFRAESGLFFYNPERVLKLSWWICISRAAREKKKKGRKHESYRGTVAFGEVPFAPRMASHNMNLKKENVQPGTLPRSVCLCALIASMILQRFRTKRGEKKRLWGKPPGILQTEPIKRAFKNSFKMLSMRDSLTFMTQVLNIYYIHNIFYFQE